jgi:hypothetical protein
MMNLKNLKLKIFKHKKTFKKDDSNIDPNVYWKIIVFTFFILSGLAFAFGLYFLNKLEKEFLVDQNSSSSLETDNQERMQGVLEYFSERENKSKTIINSPSPVIDPSL